MVTLIRDVNGDADKGEGEGRGRGRRSSVDGKENSNVKSQSTNVVVLDIEDLGTVKLRGGHQLVDELWCTFSSFSVGFSLSSDSIATSVGSVYFDKTFSLILA